MKPTNLTNILNLGLIKFVIIIAASISITACQSLFESGRKTEELTTDVLQIPFLKNSPNECYYLDEFMPTPNNMVTGEAGTLSLRYYTYEDATFKDWTKSRIILSFYSDDSRCWSLFEEYYVGDEHND